MEVEPEEGGAHSALGEERGDHGGAHGELQQGAARGVEGRRELPICGGGEEGEGEQEMPCPGSHGRYAKPTN